MENAARSVVDWVEGNKLISVPDAEVVVCSGTGNNGGDGFAMSRLLANRGYDVSVVDAGQAKKEMHRKTSHCGKNLEKALLFRIQMRHD